MKHPHIDAPQPAGEPELLNVQGVTGSTPPSQRMSNTQPFEQMTLPRGDTEKGDRIRQGSDGHHDGPGADLTELEKPGQARMFSTWAARMRNTRWLQGLAIQACIHQLGRAPGFNLFCTDSCLKFDLRNALSVASRRRIVLGEGWFRPSSLLR